MVGPKLMPFYNHHNLQKGEGRGCPYQYSKRANDGVIFQGWSIPPATPSGMSVNTPSSPIRLAQMMRLALMALVKRKVYNILFRELTFAKLECDNVLQHKPLLNG